MYDAQRSAQDAIVRPNPRSWSLLQTSTAGRNDGADRPGLEEPVGHVGPVESAVDALPQAVDAARVDEPLVFAGSKTTLVMGRGGTAFVGSRSVQLAPPSQVRRTSPPLLPYAYVLQARSLSTNAIDRTIPGSFKGIESGRGELARRAGDGPRRHGGVAEVFRPPVTISAG